MTYSGHQIELKYINIIFKSDGEEHDRLIEGGIKIKKGADEYQHNTKKNEITKAKYITNIR